MLASQSCTLLPVGLKEKLVAELAQVIESGCKQLLQRMAGLGSHADYHNLMRDDSRDSCIK